MNKLKSHAVTNITVLFISISQISTESFCNWNNINYVTPKLSVCVVFQLEVKSSFWTEGSGLWRKRWRGHYRVWDASDALRGVFSLLGTKVKTFMKQPETRENFGRAILVWTEWRQNAAIIFISRWTPGRWLHLKWLWLTFGLTNRLMVPALTQTPAKSKERSFIFLLLCSLIKSHLTPRTSDFITSC